MPLSIRDKKTDHLARELAQVTGESITEAISKALEQRLDRIRNQNSLGKRKSEIEAITQRFRNNLTGSLLTDDDLYDERGVPR